MSKGFVKQHIVPKRYLDRFAENIDNKNIIGTRMVKNRKVYLFQKSTSEVGYIKNYYDVTDKDDPKYWEHFFAEKIDTLCGHDMENIIAKATLSQENGTILSEYDKLVLSKVIVAQVMRVPDSVDYVKNKIYPRVSKQVKESVASILPSFLLEKYEKQLMNIELSDQFQKEIIFNHTFEPENFERYCKIMQEGIWVVYVNNHRNIIPFVTSDNPVLVEGVGRKETGLFYNGLASHSTCIFYPLSPSIAVAVYSRRGLLNIIADKYDGRKTILKENELKYIFDKNIKIIGQAHHHSFIPKPLFDLISENEIKIEM